MAEIEELIAWLKDRAAHHQGLAGVLPDLDRVAYNEGAADALLEVVAHLDPAPQGQGD